MSIMHANHLAQNIILSAKEILTRYCYWCCSYGFYCLQFLASSGQYKSQWSIIMKPFNFSLVTTFHCHYNCPFPIPQQYLELNAMTSLSLRIMKILI